MSLDTLYLFSRQGGDIERVLRLFARRVNGIDNASSGGGPVPRDPPEFAEFRAVCELIGRLDNRGISVLTTEDRSTDLAGTIPVDDLKAHDLVEIKKAGYGVRPIGLGSGGYQLTETKPVRVLNIHPSAIALPETLEFARMLRLEPYQTSYPVEEVAGGAVPAVRRG